MSPVVRKPAAAPVEGVNFGSLAQYTGGFILPEGDYALSFNVVLNQTMDKNNQPKGDPRLGVMVDAYPLAGGEAQQQFFSMGSKAAQSYAPNPDTGKGVVALPGGAGGALNNKTNWFLFLKSLYDCGLPEGIFVNDLTTIDGIHVHTQNIPEPEDRKGFGSQTGEVAEERRNNLIPVVTEIKEDGKPWEGTGGLPEAPAAAAPVKAGPKAVAKPAIVKPAAKPVAKPAPVAEVVEAAGDEDVLNGAINGISAVLGEEKNANGCTKLLLRTSTFKAVNAAAGGEMAQAVIDTFFGSDEALNGVLNQLGYAVVGTNVKPQ